MIFFAIIGILASGFGSLAAIYYVGCWVGDLSNERQLRKDQIERLMERVKMIERFLCKDKEQPNGGTTHEGQATDSSQGR